jgi:hypothetical protein
MNRRLIIAATIAIAGALTVPVAALAGRVDPPATTRTPVTALERLERGHRDDHEPSTEPATTVATPNPRVGAEDVVSVQIPSIVMVRVDRHARVLAVATNSGRAPRQGDLVYLYGPDGSVTQSFTFRITGHHWRGDFRQPGVFQPQAAN